MSAWVPLLLAAALGALPSGLWIARARGGPDPRRMGSGSTGATNLGRLAGPGWGLLTALLDGLKGLAAVSLPAALDWSSPAAGWLALAAVAAHIWSPLAGFRGGKGVATGWGAALVLDPAAAGAGLLLQLLVLGGARRMATASLVGAALFCALTISAPNAAATPFAWGWLPLLIWTHRGNLKRLAEGREAPLWGADRHPGGTRR
jgi:acyl phosphate:glycerol-3-phosphate acyltransferase